MRVIGGRAKGFKLKTVPGTGTRPISDRVKESLYNIIGADIEDASLWDLFAGTGSVGIEALSRGAAYVRFVDLNRKALGTIHENLKTTRLGDRAEVQKGDALILLGARADRSFEYIYIAPPQYEGLWTETLKELDAHPDWLADDAWVIVQIDPVEYKKMSFKNFEEFDQRKYGSTLLVFYEVANLTSS